MKSKLLKAIVLTLAAVILAEISHEWCLSKGLCEYLKNLLGLNRNNEN